MAFNNFPSELFINSFTVSFHWRNLNIKHVGKFSMTLQSHKHIFRTNEPPICTDGSQNYAKEIFMVIVNKFLNRLIEKFHNRTQSISGQNTFTDERFFTQWPSCLILLVYTASSINATHDFPSLFDKWVNITLMKRLRSLPRSTLSLEQGSLWRIAFQWSRLNPPSALDVNSQRNWYCFVPLVFMPEQHNIPC